MCPGRSPRGFSLFPCLYGGASDTWGFYHVSALVAWISESDVDSCVLASVVAREEPVSGAVEEVFQFFP